MVLGTSNYVEQYERVDCQYDHQILPDEAMSTIYVFFIRICVNLLNKYVYSLINEKIVVK